MSLEDKMDKLFSKIGEQAVAMIPGVWTEIVLQSEMSDASGEINLFFKTLDSPDTFLMGFNIPNIYGVSEDVYRDLYFELFDFVRELRKTLIDHGQEPFATFIMRINESGEMNVDFGYTTWSELTLNDSDVRNYLQYKYNIRDSFGEKELLKFQKMAEIENG
ncbi:immunity protein YezG family protein [uncultured Lacticaseibacillus sp.]|uniref:immunity protein YezG family protein n=1 Tax=uncultured Lacticaseibacillus sp. TaxID=2775882 RepID=UPI00259323AB|nr:immunity protein YezG family protein [uncultured Lacticaseibacillus sp.]